MDRILKAIQDSEGGLTTVDVARHAGVSKTTVIKYLSVLKSEGKCEFTEVGPSKLWMAKTASEKPQDRPRKMKANGEDNVPLQITDLCGSLSQDATISLSFRLKPRQICALVDHLQRCSRE
ncbi:MAG: winged helix-turn-helix transcriptional regulator [Methanotrichaceae archaeon]|nr:winged helix-turn-helix transcriptional regulator [Methanotrichaceae archaeon]